MSKATETLIELPRLLFSLTIFKFPNSAKRLKCYLFVIKQGQGHLSWSAVVGISSSSCFCFLLNTLLTCIPALTTTLASPGECKQLRSASMCCIISTSAAPALLQSWQERVIIATANSPEERLPLSFPLQHRRLLRYSLSTCNVSRAFWGHGDIFALSPVSCYITVDIVGYTCFSCLTSMQHSEALQAGVTLTVESTVT